MASEAGRWRSVLRFPAYLEAFEEREQQGVAGDLVDPGRLLPDDVPQQVECGQPARVLGHALVHLIQKVLQERHMADGEAFDSIQIQFHLHLLCSIQLQLQFNPNKLDIHYLERVQGRASLCSCAGIFLEEIGFVYHYSRI